MQNYTKHLTFAAANSILYKYLLKVLGSRFSVLLHDAKLLSFTNKLTPRKPKLLQPNAKLVQPNAKLLSFSSKLIAHKPKLLSFSSKLIAHKPKLLSFTIKLIAHNAKLLSFSSKLIQPDAKLLSFTIKLIAHKPKIVNKIPAKTKPFYERINYLAIIKSWYLRLSRRIRERRRISVFAAKTEKGTRENGAIYPRR